MKQILILFVIAVLISCSSDTFKEKDGNLAVTVKDSSDPLDIYAQINYYNHIGNSAKNWNDLNKFYRQTIKANEHEKEFDNMRQSALIYMFNNRTEYKETNLETLKFYIDEATKLDCKCGHPLVVANILSEIMKTKEAQIVPKIAHEHFMNYTDFASKFGVEIQGDIKDGLDKLSALGLF